MVYRNILNLLLLLALQTSDSVSKEYWRVSANRYFSKFYNGTKQKERELSNFLETLWQLDKNRFHFGDQYRLNLKGTSLFHNFFGTFNSRKVEPLFTFLNERKFADPTYKAFIQLFDNYHMNISHNDVITQRHSEEIWNFLNEIMRTDVMQFAHKFLIEQKLVSPNVSQFLAKLYELWFNFDRVQNLWLMGSKLQKFSSFERIFVGEYSQYGISGLHNWIRFYLLEKYDIVKYRGIGQEICSKNPMFLTISYEIPQLKLIKRRSPLLIGTSPEFELAAYTTVFLMNTKGRLITKNCQIEFKCTSKFQMSWRPNKCYVKNIKT